jgi:hypothetical protein
MHLSKANFWLLPSSYFLHLFVIVRHMSVHLLIFLYLLIFLLYHTCPLFVFSQCALVLDNGLTADGKKKKFFYFKLLNKLRVKGEVWLTCYLLLHLLCIQLQMWYNNEIFQIEWSKSFPLIFVIHSLTAHFIYWEPFFVHKSQLSLFPLIYVMILLIFLDLLMFILTHP